MSQICHSDYLLASEKLVPQCFFNNLSKDSSISFWHLQPEAASVLNCFLTSPNSNLLLLKANEPQNYASYLTDVVKDIIGDDKKSAVLFSGFFNAQQLFGNVSFHQSQLEIEEGLLHCAKDGVLMLSIEPFLQDISLWWRLKDILQTGIFQWHSLDGKKPLLKTPAPQQISLKVVLLGNREQLAAFLDLETNIYDWADYGEIDHYFSLNEHPQDLTISMERQQLWASFVQYLAQRQDFLPVSADGMWQLYAYLVRESENHFLVSISPQQLIKLLANAQWYAQQNKENYLTAEAFKKAFLLQHPMPLERFAYQDIFHDQVYIETSGEVVGQINGLSVVEFQGMPRAFGEPSRISCLVQFGDGELIDIEKKAELAGNIHGKGMMIVERCLANILDMPAQLPFSASLVFEQSYSEIDGDSASLAAFLTLVSALSLEPIPQSIAVTGTIDQFGLVHAVGGVNHKIEGFFAICQGRGLTKKQGVIIPRAVLQQLSLSEAVQSAVSKNEFFIWAVDDVYQACEILFSRELMEDLESSEKSAQIPLETLIRERLALFNENQEKQGKWWSRIFG